MEGAAGSDSRHRPQDPWADIMEASRMCSNNISIQTFSIHAKATNCGLPFRALEVYDHCVSISTVSILAKLSKLELCMADFTGGKDYSHWRTIRGLARPTKMLSATSNLQSLSIDFTGHCTEGIPYNMHEPSLTTFGAILGGCHLPRLLTLHQCKLTFLEAEFSAFIQHSPGLRGLCLRNFDMIELEESLWSTHIHPRCWERLLDTMKQAWPYLQHFHMSNSCICEDEHGSSVYWSRTVPNRLVQKFMFNEGENPMVGVHDNGNGVSLAIVYY